MTAEEQPAQDARSELLHNEGWTGSLIQFFTVGRRDCRRPVHPDGRNAASAVVPQVAVKHVLLGTRQFHSALKLHLKQETETWGTHVERNRDALDLPRGCHWFAAIEGGVKETSMNKISIGPLAIGALLVLAAPVLAQSSSEESQEKSVALSSVPQPARDAARQALGSDPTEAKIISGTRPQQYELEARNSSGQEASVHVQGDGTIVKRETENEQQERNER